MIEMFLLLFHAFLLALSAGFMINSLSSFSKKVGISEYAIGAVIVAIGTSLPELTTGIFSSIEKVNEISLGNVIGANILVVTLVLGLMALVGKEIKITKDLPTKILYETFLIAFLPLILSLDGVLSKLDGIVLLFTFFVYTWMLFGKEDIVKKRNVQIPTYSVMQDIIIFTIALSALLFNAKLIVEAAKVISQVYGIPLYLLGILLGFGTTTPELTTELTSIIKKHQNIGLGDIFGSIVANSSLVLGIASIINPIRIVSKVHLTSALFMLASVYIAINFVESGKINWKNGIGLLLLFITYMVVVELESLV